MSLATPFAFDSKAVLAQDLPGNHRGGRSRLFGGSFLLEGCSGGICSTRIDFQLGTNAADTNGSNRQREGCWQKNSDAGSSSWSADGLAIPGSCPVIARKTTGGHPHSTRRKRPGTRVYRGLSPTFDEKCAENAQRYNRREGSCAH